MSTGRPIPPTAIPTLTEVVTWPEAVPLAATPPVPLAGLPLAPVASPPAQVAPPAAPVAASRVSPAARAMPRLSAPAGAAVPPAPVAVPAGAPMPPPAQAQTPAAAAVGPLPLDEAQMMRRVLSDLQRQVDLVLEVRLRELLAPVLSRAADALIRDARKELTTAMRDAVSRAIAQELARRQDRGSR